MSFSCEKCWQQARIKMMIELELEYRVKKYETEQRTD